MGRLAVGRAGHEVPHERAHVPPGVDELLREVVEQLWVRRSDALLAEVVERARDGRNYLVAMSLGAFALDGQQAFQLVDVPLIDPDGNVRSPPGVRSMSLDRIREAVREVVVRSTRHIVSTTVTTGAGFLPLILAGGGFWPPLAVSIVGGVTGATVLALYFVPAAFLLLRRRRAPLRLLGSSTGGGRRVDGSAELVPVAAPASRP